LFNQLKYNNINEEYITLNIYIFDEIFKVKFFMNQLVVSYYI